jgi:hypothetical protein
MQGFIFITGNSGGYFKNLCLPESKLEINDKTHSCKLAMHLDSFVNIE